MPERTVYIRPTSQCNLGCAYCGFPISALRMSARVAQDAVGFIKGGNNGFTRLLFTGGEPFLNVEIMQLFADSLPDMAIVLITNGTVLNDKVRTFLRSTAGRLGIILSLDGDREIHNKNRRNSFDRVMANLDTLLPYITCINMVVTPETIFRLHESVVFLRCVGAPRISVILQNDVDWDRAIDFERFREYFLTYCLDLTELKDALTTESLGMCDCGQDIFINELGEIFVCSNFTDDADNRIGDIYQGVDVNRIRPFLVCRSRNKFCCLLKNRQQNGSIFRDYDISGRFRRFYLDLVRLVH